MAVGFDGSNDTLHGDVSPGPLNNEPGPFTWMLWFRSQSTSQSDTYVATCYSSGNQLGFDYATMFESQYAPPLRLKPGQRLACPRHSRRRAPRASMWPQALRARRADVAPSFA